MPVQTRSMSRHAQSRELVTNIYPQENQTEERMMRYQRHRNFRNCGSKTDEELKLIYGANVKQCNHLCCLWKQDKCCRCSCTKPNKFTTLFDYCPVCVHGIYVERFGHTR